MPVVGYLVGAHKSGSRAPCFHRRRMNDAMKGVFSGAGGVVAAAGSALCCAGPVVAVTLGVSGAGLSVFEPYRPYFLALTAGFLLFGFWQLDREERASCDPDKPCADPVTRKKMKVMLWVATAFAVIFATFPSWQTFIFE